MFCTICNSPIQGKQRKYCSNRCKQKAHWYHRKNTNSYHSQTLRAIRRKLMFIDMLGGKCSKCGYEENLAALEFNHLESRGKKFNLDSRKLSNTRLEILLDELSKCELLCANCHREYHNPELKIREIRGQVAKLVTAPNS